MDQDLNARTKAIKFLEGNIGINLRDLGLGNGVLGIAPKHKQPKGKKILNISVLLMGRTLMILMKAILEERKRRKVARVVSESSNGLRKNARDRARDESARPAREKRLSCVTRKNENSSMAYTAN